MAVIESDMPEKRESLQRLPSLKFPVVHVHGGISYEAYKVNSDNRRALRRRVLPFEQQFEYPDSFVTHEKVVHFIRDGGEVVIGRTTGRNPNKDVAVVTQEMRRVAVEGQVARVLSVGIRVVLPEFQKHGIGAHLAVEGIIRHNPDLVIGMTRTWRIPNMLEDTGFINNIPPFTGEFTPFLRSVLERALDKSILEKTDLETGVCKRVYLPADIKRFLPPLTNERGVGKYKKMRELGVEPEKGDGVRYAGIVDHDAVAAVIARGYIALEEDTVGLDSVKQILVGMTPTGKSVFRFITNFFASLSGK